MAAETREHEIDIDDNAKVREEELKLDEYESFEIELEDIDWDSVDFLMPDDVQLTFVPDENVQEIQPPLLTTPKPITTYVCGNCKKKYKKKFYYEKHITKCGTVPTEPLDNNAPKTGNKRKKDSSSVEPKEPIKKRKMNLTEEMLSKESSAIMITALQQSSEDRINHLEVKTSKTFGNKIADLAVLLLGMCDTESFNKASKTLVMEFFHMFEKGDIWDDKFLTSFWKDFHKYTLKKEHQEILSEFTPDALLPYLPSLFHTTCISIVGQIVSTERKLLPSQQLHKPTDKMSERQQEVLRYVAGYVVYSLKKHYNRLKKSNVQSTRVAAHAAVDFLTLLDTRFEVDMEARSYLDFTKKWVGMRNRGGLVKVNDDTFIFMRRLENRVRQVLTLDLLKNYRGEDIRDIIDKKLKENTLVDNGWNILARKLGNEQLRTVLKNQVISKWVDIRASAV